MCSRRFPDLVGGGTALIVGTHRLPFANRAAAGRVLASTLARVPARPSVVLALPRGGVPVAAEVAAAIGAVLDVLVVRKLGMPGQPELAFGAVASGVDAEHPILVRNDALLRRTGVPARAVESVIAREVAELRRRERAYRGDRPVVDLTGQVAVLVDDGLATGASARAAVLAVRARCPAAVLLAVPVAPPSALAALDAMADHVVCAAVPRHFLAVGQCYRDFHQVSDAEVRELLR